MQEKKSFSRVLGTGGYLPGKPVTNQDLVNRLRELDVETSDEWIKERSGITSRYFCGEMSTRDMGYMAAKQAIEAASIDVTSIDLIIVATTTPDLIFPSVACHIEKDLGLERCTSFDIQAVCSGFVYALTVADLFLKTGMKNNALVIGAERLSTILNWRDRSTCVLFGDGAGAVVLGKSSVPGIIASDISSSGKFCDILRATGTPKNGVLEGTGYAEMQGQEVFRKAVESLSESGMKLLDTCAVDVESIDWFIPHQANIRIINKVAEKLNVPDSKVIKCVHKHANTSAASIPLALNEGISNGKIQFGDRLLLQGVGGGLTWGSILMDL